MAIDLTTDVGRVRLLISDVDEANLTFADAEVQAFLDLEGGNVRLAAAVALETLASNEALVYKKMRAERLLEVDGTAVAKALMDRAAALREQATDEAGEFAIADGGTLLAEMTESPTRLLLDWTL